MLLFPGLDRDIFFNIPVGEILQPGIFFNRDFLGKQGFGTNLGEIFRSSECICIRKINKTGTESLKKKSRCARQSPM